MSVVLMLHADETDFFLTCRLCNLCLKINQEHHCNNLPVSLKIKHCNESCERCKAKKKMQPRALVLYKQTAISAAIVDGLTQNLMIRPRPVNTAFA